MRLQIMRKTERRVVSDRRGENSWASGLLTGDKQRRRDYIDRRRTVRGPINRSFKVPDGISQEAADEIMRLAASAIATIADTYEEQHHAKQQMLDEQEDDKDT
jgi:hypothetical protein